MPRQRVKKYRNFDLSQTISHNMFNLPVLNEAQKHRLEVLKNSKLRASESPEFRNKYLRESGSNDGGYYESKLGYESSQSAYKYQEYASLPPNSIGDKHKKDREGRAEVARSSAAFLAQYLKSMHGSELNKDPIFQTSPEVYSRVLEEQKSANFGRVMFG